MSLPGPQPRSISETPKFTRRPDHRLQSNVTPRRLGVRACVGPSPCVSGLRWSITPRAHTLIAVG
jgi:hypothetical protein